MLEKLPEAVGHALEGQRAGIDKVLINSVHPSAALTAIALTSPAFQADSRLPERFTADGDGASPPLNWQNVPPQTAALALIVEDADSPTPEPLVHAIVVDIDPQSTGLTEGEFRTPEDAVAERLGRNSYLMRGWLPPDPPPGHGVHRYVFQIFALSSGDSLSTVPGRGEIAVAVRERAIGCGALIGTYQREHPVRTEAPATVPAAVEDRAPLDLEQGPVPAPTLPV
ncbi:MAG TPA: YbhB/YbcL family Raf kinase inhibitor-like protein [Steroidobacteraceae bacterium]|nr:YbhB/YbcL family Raf kinase inhibitor-like protein [Steroidobacteraceae bacterium]